MDKFRYPIHPLRRITTGPSERGKSVFLNNLFSDISKRSGKTYNYSPSLNRDLYHKISK